MELFRTQISYLFINNVFINELIQFFIRGNEITSKSKDCFFLHMWKQHFGTRDFRECNIPSVKIKAPMEADISISRIQYHAIIQV